MNDDIFPILAHELTRRRLLARMVIGGGSLVLGSQFLAACSSDETSDSPGAKKVTVAFSAFENNLTPFTLTMLALPVTHDLVHLVHDALFWSQAKLKPEPFLAKRAAPNAEHTEWTVKLRSGVSWHDGKPFTAEDVKFTFDYYRHAPGVSGRYGHHVFDTPLYDHAEIIDEHTVKLLYSGPAPTFTILPGADLPIVAKHIWENVPEPKKFSTELPVGTGPYQLVEMVPDQLYRFKANEKYFKGKPLVDELVLPIIKDPSAAFAALRAGQVDLVARNVPPELIKQFEKQSDLTVVSGSRWESVQLNFNCKKAPLSDPRLRKAFSLGIDVDTILSQVLLGRGKPGNDNFLHPSSPWALPDGQHEFDAARAEKMLDDAGYAKPEGGAVRQTDNGEPLEFSLLVSSFYPQGIRACQLAAQQVAKIGVKLKVTSLDPASIRQARTAAPGKVPEFDIFLSTLEAHAHADPDCLYFFFRTPLHTQAGPASTGYSNPEFDSMSDRAKKEIDPQARKKLLYTMQRTLAAETPALVLYYPDGIYAYRQQAYSGWISDAPQGIFTKRSFLPGYSRKKA